MAARRLTLPLMLLWAGQHAPLQAAVRVTAGSITLPTYEEGTPSQEPPFTLFQAPGAPAVYPYPVRRAKPAVGGGSGAPVRKTWRALDIENEYLKCTVLPDLGGRIYTCIDKLSKRNVFFASPAVHKQDAPGRGVWMPGGDQFEFPVSPGRTSASPVDFAMRENADGSASIFTSDTDRVGGLRWEVETILRPESGVVEQKVTLSNPTPLRQPYSWWNDASVPVYDDTKVAMPCYLSMGGEAEKFAARCNEDFLGAYSVHEGAGVAHFARVQDLPGKRVGAGGTEEGERYLRLAAGLSAEPGAVGFLEARESRTFTEYWLPLRGLGGLSRANPAAAVYLAREGGQVKIALNVYQRLTKAKLRVFESSKVLLDETLTLEPEKVLVRSITDSPPASKAHVELLDEQGRVLLAHTEDYYDALTVAPAAAPQPKAAEPSAAKLLEDGRKAELAQNLLGAVRAYQSGRETFAEDKPLALADGRAALALNRWEGAQEPLSAAGYPEALYYLGLAQSYGGNDAKARELWSSLGQDYLFGTRRAWSWRSFSPEPATVRRLGNSCNWHSRAGRNWPGPGRWRWRCCGL